MMSAMEHLLLAAHRCADWGLTGTRERVGGVRGGRGKVPGGGIDHILRRRASAVADARTRRPEQVTRERETKGHGEVRRLTLNALEGSVEVVEVEGGRNRGRRRRAAVELGSKIRPAASFPACVYDGGGRGEHGGAEGLLSGPWRGSERRQSPAALEPRVRLEERKKEGIGWWLGFGPAAAGLLYAGRRR